MQYVDRDEMKYECGVGGGVISWLRAKVWSALSTPTPNFSYSPMC